MSPENLHEFFLGSTGVAGALIGLLFVAVSVAGDKSAAAAIPPELYRVRAQAALTTFVNSLVVSLVALIPADALGTTALVAALMGLASVVGSLFVLLRRHQSRVSKRDVTLLASLFVLFLCGPNYPQFLRR
ncbi:DUF3290 domain-containing protein [Rudaeicoccus suwonensis]|uniref:Uncharacterized protein n=1 Tax=Rudaeicoccus suwonensis TaxID=657409 RepID=A0A561E4E2_9MICO|nr:DUF3290 domain-containing protein [Rudaeicoccus suwonensis]TWE10485.1 hypothetical protein BKA23_2848 [Rudaeicoccus suwonensis]